MMRKQLPIGIEDFKELIDKDYFFVDKTLMIKELLDNLAKVTLFTRPRRFGKTLNMSMLQRFFEKSKESNIYLFEKLNISQYPEYMKHQGKYPVITISLKSMKKDNFESSFKAFKELIRIEYTRQKDLLINFNILNEAEKGRYNRFVDMVADDSEYYSAIQFLSSCIYESNGVRSIILIDEYDVPLETSYTYGFYDKMINLIRSVFESALKTNSALEFAVLTGCLRISKESIFTGLNNPIVHSVISSGFSDSFGFTQGEIDSILQYYNLENHKDEIKNWYDGYIFGKKEIYNPWSTTNHIWNLLNDENSPCCPYWSNTSSNDIIRHIIQNANFNTKAIIEDLMNGIPYETTLYEDITYAQLDAKYNYVWSFLLFTGYLKASRTSYDGRRCYYKLEIPNIEVETIYEDTISQWLTEKIESEDRSEFFNFIINKDVENINAYIQHWLAETISFFDKHENYYHGFMAGLLTGFDGYTVKSNRESGDGRFDIVLKSRIGKKYAIVFEFKISPDEDSMEKYADEAIKQIEDKNYDAELRSEKYKNIIKYGISFCEKICYVKLSQYSD